MRENKVVLLAGPPGCGKTTMLNLIIKDLNLRTFVNDSTQNLISMLTTQSLNAQANPKCIVVNDCEQQEKLPELLRAASKRGKNRLVLTTTDLFNQKLKSIKSTYFKDRSTIVQMPDISQQQMRSILTAAYTKEKLTYKNKSFQDTPIQFADQLITQIVNVCGQDIRQGLQ